MVLSIYPNVGFPFVHNRRLSYLANSHDACSDSAELLFMAVIHQTRRQKPPIFPLPNVVQTYS